MDKVCIGKIVSTHGIKGEVKILSDFPYKEKAFRVGNSIVIDDKTYNINSYRVHKKFDMITLDNYNNINDVLPFMKKKVYIDREDLKLEKDEILDEDLLEYKVIDQNNNEGTITEVFMAGGNNKVLRVMFKKEVLIPYSLIKSINSREKKILVELIEGMI